MARSLIPYNSQELTEELRQKARIELHESDSTRTLKLQELRNLLKEEEDLIFPDDDNFLLQFLRTKKFDVQRAFTLCKNYFRSRNGGLWKSIDYSHIWNLVDPGPAGILPYRDPEGCVLFYYHGGCNWDPEVQPNLYFFHTLLILQMYALQSPATQISGLKVIANYEGMTFKQVLQQSPKLTWQYLKDLQNSLPGRLKAVHVVNENPVFTHLWAIIKRLLSKKLQSRFHFHGRNLLQFHEMIPPAILPTEVGGDLGPFRNSRSFIENMRNFERVYDKMMTYGYKSQNTT